MRQDWRDCIVTLIDMAGVKKRAERGAGSALMLRLHALVARETEALQSVARTYVWNDSALLLSYVDETAVSFELAMRDAERLKRCIDGLAPSYAIAVKGQAFPPPEGNGQLRTSRVTVIEASSWAMANCFEIERILGPKWRKPWYIDVRIINKIKTMKPSGQEKVKLLPTGIERQVCVFGGDLWGEAAPHQG